MVRIEENVEIKRPIGQVSPMSQTPKVVAMGFSVTGIGTNVTGQLGIGATLRGDQRIMGRSGCDCEGNGLRAEQEMGRHNFFPKNAD